MFPSQPRPASVTDRSLSGFGDVVVVSMNHRLNILGTLDLSAYGPQYASSRHTGTADLLTALQWVKDNVEAFGGGPDNVMIFGQSGGFPSWRVRYSARTRER